MLLRLSLRVSWTCLLLFSSAAGYPATKADYRYPYTATWGSGGGSAPGSNLQSERPPLVSLQREAAPQQVARPPSSLGAPLVAADSSQSYEPNRFIVTYDSSSNKPSGAPGVPSQSAGYVSPPADPLTPVQPPPVSTGPSDTGSDVAAAGPAYGFYPDPGFTFPAGNTAAASDSGAGADPYPAAPASYDVGAGAAYDAPAASYYGYPYGSPSGADSLWSEQPAGGAGASFDPSSWMPSSSFPDFSVWDSDDSEVPQTARETSPLPPSSYIIQSRNGYQRAREVLSHTKYSPEYPEPPPVFAYRAAEAPSQSPPMTGSKGGQKV